MSEEPNTELKLWGIHTLDDHFFLQQNVIALGWKEIGDLNQISPSRDAFKNRYQEIYPDAKKGSIANWCWLLM